MLWILFCFVLQAAAVQPPPNASREWKAPFISADGFRTFADFAYDDLDRSMQPESVGAGSTVFVKGDEPYFDEFFERIHPRIAAPYILITHYMDEDGPGRFRAYLDDPKIIAWFTENYDGTPHPKIHSLPIGIANYNWHAGNVETIRRVESLALPKAHFCHMSMRTWTFRAERELAWRLFANAPFCYTTEYKPFEEYLIDCASSKFAISPRGNARDTHRVWECIHFNTIPIVKTSTLDSLYEGLPVLIVDEWEQVTEPFLIEKYEAMSKQTYSMEKMTMEYWINQINEAKLAYFLDN